MILKKLTPSKALKKAFRNVKHARVKIEAFRKHLINLLEETNDSKDEKFHENLITEFLKKSHYDATNSINSKRHNDLVIHNGISPDSTVGVIFEIKRPANKIEMPTTNNINVKAFQELVLYYLRERIDNNNNEIKHLIVTNVREWFIFDANVFEKIFVQSKEFINKYNNFKDKNLVDSKTDFFYKTLAEPFINSISSEIEFTYINLQDYNKYVLNPTTEIDDSLILLYKILSPEHLLKLRFVNDSNSLNKQFYNELLHIIGLVETTNKSKKLIERNKPDSRNSGSILEDTIIQLHSLDKLSRLNDIYRYGETDEERLFNIALELTITWINRILFLKLLEGQLKNYHINDSSYEFLNYNKIKEYDILDSLFFQVLACKLDQRNEDVKQVFKNITYINSSLFEPTELEQSTLFISNLKDNKKIPIYPETVLKDNNGKRRSGEIITLEYLFEFLGAYNFGADDNKHHREEQKTIINASVLGLIFEKINGYKDGSFFTPGFITMYMCRETIRKAIVQKFNDSKNWVCKSIEEVHNQIKDLDEANKIVNSIKICDPAVGSGHFLVSALNEIIAIKSELGILQSSDGKRLKNYHVEVENDEIFVTDEDGIQFKYNPKNKESQRIQETLFHEKQTIIENCLFGVDINPNSVKICRLRLWIELLKCAYYKNVDELETLPNIDINIKCGNSLVSRFAIDADLNQALKKSKWSIDSYRIAVDTYRNAESKEQKREMEKLIANIKSDFKSEIDNPFKKKISAARGKIDKIATEINTQKNWGDKVNKQLFKDLETATSNFKKLEAERDDIETNKIFENAFEWRFEFPEILNDDGDFIGFDVIFGNPPYGVSIKGLERDYIVSTISKVPDFEIYYFFIDRGYQLLKDKGHISFIIPNTILFNVFAQNYRLDLFNKWLLNEILDCTEINIFEDATVRNIIFQFGKDNSQNTLSYKRTNKVKNFEELAKRPSVVVTKEIVEKGNQNWGLIFKLDKSILTLIEKIKTSKLLGQQYDSTQGYIPYRKSDLLKIYEKSKA